MLNNLSIRRKILYVLILVSVLSLAVIGVLAYNIGRNTIETDAFNQLTSIREIKASQIEDYFTQISNQVVTFSQNLMVIDAMKEFEATHETVFEELELSSEDLKYRERELEHYYLNEFITRLEPNSEESLLLENFLPSDKNIAILQSLYISSNPNDTGEKDVLLNPEDGSVYSQVHEKYHPIFRDYLDKFGFYDIFLVDVDSGGHIIYSVFKEVDFQTSLIDGPYSDTNFGRAYKQALNTTNSEASFLVDFEAYQPSYNAPAAFISSPIWDEDSLIGVLIFQMPIGRINDIMTNNQKWEDVGLGVSGETYIVGEDYLLRNQSRFLLEDKENYFSLLAEIGTPIDTIDRIKAYNSSISLQEVQTRGTLAAHSGRTGTDIFPDYRGVPVFSSYRPLEIPGVNWVIMSEIDEAEVNQPLRQLTNRLVIGITALFFAIVFVSNAFSRTITNPIKKLGSVAEKIADGNLDVSPNIHSKDEVGQVSETFDLMRIKLKKTLSELEAINLNLEQKVAERTKDLEASEIRFRSIIDRASDGIIVINDEGQVTLWNNSAENLFNYRFEEIKGKSIEKIVPMNFLKGHKNAFHKAVKNRKLKSPGVTHELIGLRKGGSEFPVELSLSEWEVSGKLYFTGIIRDISQRKEAEAQLRLLSGALQEAASGVVITDPNDIVEWVNPAFSKLTGYAIEEIVGKPITILNSDKHPEEFYERIVNSLKEGKVWRGEMIQKRKDESLYPEGITITPILDENGLIVNIVSIKQDITERKELERQLELSNERMSEELNFARDIQMSLLPLIFPAFPLRYEFNIFANLIPAREVGGDFYDFYFIDEDHLCFVIGDVSGKGAPGALLMAVSKTLIKSRAMDDIQPSSILTHVNNELSQNNETSMFVTVFLGIMNIRTGEVTYTNAGHNPPFIRRKNRKIEKLDAFHGPVLGALPNMYYKESKLKLATGDILTLYTDGVSEAMNSKDQLYTEDRLEDLLRSPKLNTSQKLIDQVFRDVKKHENGAEQADDITMLSLEFTGDTGSEFIDRKVIKVINKLENMTEVEDSFEKFSKKHKIPDTARQQLNLVLDEMLNNIINYAYRDNDKHYIDVEFVLNGKRLVINIKDDGVPFNPFALDPPNISASLDDQKIGGLGIYLVRGVMDEYFYNRLVGKNVITMSKIITE